MRLTINGDATDVDATAPLTIEGLLALRGLPPGRVAVEHNGRIIRKDERAVVVVVDGDRLEIVTLVGGG